MEEHKNWISHTVFFFQCLSAWQKLHIHLVSLLYLGYLNFPCLRHIFLLAWLWWLLLSSFYQLYRLLYGQINSSPVLQSLSLRNNNLIVKNTRMHNFFTHSQFTIVAAELCGKSSLVPWSSNLQQCIQDVWALESICCYSGLNLELCKSSFGFMFVRFTYDLALDRDLHVCLVQICGQCAFGVTFQHTESV